MWKQRNSQICPSKQKSPTSLFFSVWVLIPGNFIIIAVLSQDCHLSLCSWFNNFNMLILWRYYMILRLWDNCKKSPPVAILNTSLDNFLVFCGTLQNDTQIMVVQRVNHRKKVQERENPGDPKCLGLYTIHLL